MRRKAEVLDDEPDHIKCYSPGRDEETPKIKPPAAFKGGEKKEGQFDDIVERDR